MPRGRFDGLRLDLADGMTVHVFGRPELYEARGVFQLRALSIEPLGLGADPRRPRAPEAEAGRGGPVRARAQAAASGSSAADRRADRQRGSREARLRHRCPGPLSSSESSRRADVCSGAGSAGRDRGDDADPRTRARGGRDRAHSRRRELRGPAAVQRRARDPRRGRMRCPRRLRGRARAGHAALRPRGRRARIDADCSGTPRRPGRARTSRAPRYRSRRARPRRRCGSRARAQLADP